MADYLVTLALTLLVELTVAFGLAPRRLRRDTLWAVLCVNLLSHPIASWLVWTGRATFLQVELLVVLFEWSALSAALRDPRLGLRIAVPINLATFLLSFVL